MPLQTRSYMSLRWEKLHRLRHMLHRQALAQFPLFKGQLPILEHISLHPGCTQIEVAQALLLSASFIAQSTKRMQHDGLIEKRMDQNNQRCKRLYPTSKGASLTTQCRASLNKVDEAMFSIMSDEELEDLDRYVDRLLKHVAAALQTDTENPDALACIPCKSSMHPYLKENAQHDQEAY